MSSSSDRAVSSLEEIISQYCSSPSVYPDVFKLRRLLSNIPDDIQRITILQQEYIPSKTALWWAASRDDTEIITTLIRSIQPVNRLNLLLNDRWAPLHVAAGLGHTQSVKRILDCLTSEQKFELLIVQNNEETVIHEAAKHGHTNVITTVLDCFPSEQQVKLILMKNSRDKTAITVASERVQTQTEKTLREYLQNAENLISKIKRG